MEAAESRYNDPFVRILELYALAAIGALDPEDAKRMKEITPDLQKIYNVEFGWKKLVEHVMEFGPDAEPEVRQAWADRKREAEEAGESVKPATFAHEFADRYFPTEESDDQSD